MERQRTTNEVVYLVKAEGIWNDGKTYYMGRGRGSSARCCYRVENLKSNLWTIAYNTKATAKRRANEENAQAKQYGWHGQSYEVVKVEARRVIRGISLYTFKPVFDAEVLSIEKVTD